MSLQGQWLQRSELGVSLHAFHSSHQCWATTTTKSLHSAAVVSHQVSRMCVCSLRAQSAPPSAINWTLTTCLPCFLSLACPVSLCELQQRTTLGWKSMEFHQSPGFPFIANSRHVQRRGKMACRKRSSSRAMQARCMHLYMSVISSHCVHVLVWLCACVPPRQCLDCPHPGCCPEAPPPQNRQHWLTDVTDVTDVQHWLTDVCLFILLQRRPIMDGDDMTKTDQITLLLKTDLAY